MVYGHLDQQDWEDHSVEPRHLDDPRGAKHSSGVVLLHQQSRWADVRRHEKRATVVSVGLCVTVEQLRARERQASCRRRGQGRRRRAFWVAGFLATVVAGSLLSTAPALAASPLSWASPVRADDQPPFESSTAITGVSCPSTGLCVAVDGAGDVLSTTDPTGGAGAWAIAAGVAEGFDGVSCPSTELCVAVGGGDVATSTDPTGGAGAWSVASLIPAASQTPNKPNRLDAVSCPSARLCVATDDDGNVWTSTDPTGGVAAWTETNVDGPKKILSGVSCPTESLCVAVDRGGGDVLTSTDPSGGAGAWTLTKVDKDTLFDVSCSSETLCVATDSGGNVLTSTDPTGGAGAWSPTHVSGGLIEHVSCTSWDLCVALDGNEVIMSMEPTKGKQAWTSTAIETTNRYGGYESLESSACPAAGVCVLTDSGSAVVTSTEPTGGAGAWTIADLEVGFNSLQGVSCAPAGPCVGVDEAGNVVGAADPVGGAGAWESAHVDDHSLDGVSCPSAGLCVAVDEAGDVVTSTEPTGTASAWHVADVDGTTPLLGVSCASARLCVAIDRKGNVVTSTEPTGSPGAWSVASVADRELRGVSCPTEQLCVVTAGGDAITSTDPTGGASAWTARHVGASASISCPSTGLCVDTGIGAFGILTTTDPLGEESAWTETSFGGEEEEPVAFNGFDEVSCGSEALCVATTLGGNGSPGNVMISAGPTEGAEAWTEAEVYGGPIVKPIPIIELYSRVLTGVSCTPDLCAVIDNSGKVIVGTLSPVTSVNTSLPVASGTPAPGQTLSCSNGSWTGYPPPTFTYQWLRDGTPIGGASTSAYVVQTADQGHGLACQVTASNSAGSESVTSNTLQVPPAQAPGGGGSGGGSSGGSGGPGTLTGTVSNAFVLNRMESVAARGAVKITLTLPGPGTLQIVGRASAAHLAGASRAQKKRETPVVIARLRLMVSKAGRIVVTLVPTGSAKTVLARRGKLRATVTITYAPQGGASRSIVRAVTFRLKRRR